MSTSEPSPADRPTPPGRPSFRSRWLLALALVAAVGAIYPLGLHRYLSWEVIRSHLDQIKAHVDENPLLDGLGFALVYTLGTALSLPAAGVLSLLAGALFGGWRGVALVSIASTLGATLAFLSSRYLFRDLVQQRFGDQLKTFNEGVKREGAYYLFTLRLVPIFRFRIKFAD